MKAVASPVLVLQPPKKTSTACRWCRSRSARILHPRPHARVFSVSCVLQLLHGDKDKTCPAEMSTELFNARNAASDEAPCPPCLSAKRHSPRRPALAHFFAAPPRSKTPSLSLPRCCRRQRVRMCPPVRHARIFSSFRTQTTTM